MKKYTIGVFSMILGFAPIGLGYYVNSIYMKDEVGQPGLMMISLAVFLVWFIYGMLLGGVLLDIKTSILLLHGVGIVCYLSSVIQEYIIGRYVSGPIGIIPQFYFLPMLKVSYNVDLFNLIHRLPTIFLVTLVLMILIYVAGWQFRVRIISRKGIER